MPLPKAVIFDLGDTLVCQSAPFSPLAGTERLLELAQPGCTLTAKEIQAFASSMSAEIERRSDDPELLLEFPCQAFQRTLNETLGVSYTVDYPELEQLFWSAAIYFQPAEGIYDVLDTLRDRGIRTCVLSNAAFSGKVLEGELESHGMLDYFEFLLSSCDYGFKKPSPFFFNVALARLGVAPEEAWMVGDKVEFDVVGARKSGLRPFWYNPDGREDLLGEACTVLTHWREFVELLAA